MKSPITGKEMKLIQEQDVLCYRKEEFPVFYHFYLCGDTGERFTNDETDEINLIQVHNQYREKYRIPFPEEIARIREKYNVSAGKMSEILGLGANTYRLYEAGEMPSVANGRLILSVKEPGEFLRQVEASSHLLAAKELQKIKETVRKLQIWQDENFWDVMFEQKIFTHQSPDEYTGYKEPQLEKIAQVIAYFNGKMDLYKTKLNKLLFYTDFCYYRKTGYSMTGIAYRAIPYGPVPAEYQKMYIKLCDDKLVDIWQVDVGNGYYGELIGSCTEFDGSVFKPLELQILKAVGDTFKDKNTDVVVGVSHKELAWTDNEAAKSLISYQKYAFVINGVVC
jgi:DNA-binding transcriptional regulator YiaG